jgi:hypothetical protein
METLIVQLLQEYLPLQEHQFVALADNVYSVYQYEHDLPKFDKIILFYPPPYDCPIVHCGDLYVVGDASTSILLQVAVEDVIHLLYSSQTTKQHFLNYALGKRISLFVDNKLSLYDSIVQISRQLFPFERDLIKAYKSRIHKITYNLPEVTMFPEHEKHFFVSINSLHKLIDQRIPFMFLESHNNFRCFTDLHGKLKRITPGDNDFVFNNQVRMAGTQLSFNVRLDYFKQRLPTGYFEILGIPDLDILRALPEFIPRMVIPRKCTYASCKRCVSCWFACRRLLLFVFAKHLDGLDGLGKIIRDMIGLNLTPSTTIIRSQLHFKDEV